MEFPSEIGNTVIARDLYAGLSSHGYAPVARPVFFGQFLTSRGLIFNLARPASLGREYSSGEAASSA
jgi:hypothetical protein